VRKDEKGKKEKIAQESKREEIKKRRKKRIHARHFTICYHNSFSVRRQDDTDSRTILA
jgi:uncharacterized Zn-finger protein